MMGKAPFKEGTENHYLIKVENKSELKNGYRYAF